MPRFGMKVPHLTCDSHTSFKVKRSKVRVTDRQGPNLAATLLVKFHLAKFIIIAAFLMHLSQSVNTTATKYIRV